MPPIRPKVHRIWVWFPETYGQGGLLEAQPFADKKFRLG